MAGDPDPYPENHKWLKVFLKILIQIPWRSQFLREVRVTFCEIRTSDKKKVVRNPTPSEFSGSANGFDMHVLTSLSLIISPDWNAKES